MMPEEDPRLWELMVQARAKRELAAQLASPGVPTRMLHPSGRRALVQADMSEPGMFRVTTFDASGPWGHTQHNTLDEAFLTALQSGYRPLPTDQGAPAL